jgi:SAM-dependent methyltransferase
MLKQYLPARLHPPLRKLKHLFLRAETERDRREAELRIYRAVEHVHDLPKISDYWFGKHIVPMLEPLGFRNSIELFRVYIARVCRADTAQTCRILSIAAGDCASEIGVAEWLRRNSIHNFRFECLDINPAVLERARSAAASKGVAAEFEFRIADMDTWLPERSYQVILAIQCLHHFPRLEMAFGKISDALDPAGYFVADDMIGRNGHQRWPEAKVHVEAFWGELPARYKYNHAFKTQDKDPCDYDFSRDSYEGVRSQDILRLLVERFHFEVFAGFANVIDVFVERTYGPNFDPGNAWDRDFIDRVHALDVREMDAGRIKPTHMYAAMMKTAGHPMRFHAHWSPQYCIRNPD